MFTTVLLMTTTGIFNSPTVPVGDAKPGTLTDYSSETKIEDTGSEAYELARQEAG